MLKEKFKRIIAEVQPDTPVETQDYLSDRILDCVLTHMAEVYINQYLIEHNTKIELEAKK